MTGKRRQPHDDPSLPLEERARLALAAVDAQARRINSTVRNRRLRTARASNDTGAVVPLQLTKRRRRQPP